MASDQVAVTVSKLSGDAAFGPTMLPSSTTIGELKALFEPEKPKRLSCGDKMLPEEATLQAFTPEVFLSVAYCSELEVDVGGAWFGDSRYIPSVPDQELGRNVWKLDGVCWLAFGCKVTLPKGSWKLSLRIKRLPGMRIGTDIITRFNDRQVQRLRLEDEFRENDAWTLFELGTWADGGEVSVSVKGADCSEGGQGSKSGLLIDKLVCTAS